MLVRVLSLLLLLACVVSAQNITITSTSVPTYTVSPKALIIEGSGQQSITFTNNSAAAIGIQFVPNPVYPSLVVFNNIASLSPNGTNTQTPQVANGSVNYYVVAGANRYGPYAIQVGSGPLYLSLSYDAGTGEILASSDSVVIPVGGTLENGFQRLHVQRLVTCRRSVYAGPHVGRRWRVEQFPGNVHWQSRTLRGRYLNTGSG